MTGTRTTIHFLHIPKTGGTAITAALTPHLATSRYELVIHGHDVALSDLPEGERFFFSIRDPVRRFCSAFYSRRRCGRPRYDYPWTADEAAAFSEFETPGQLAAGLAQPDGPLRDAAVSAMNGIRLAGNHYRQLLGEERTLRDRRNGLVAVLRTESLNGDFARLRSVLGLPQAELPVCDVEAHRNPPGLDLSMGRGERAALDDWFADDHRMLRLSMKLRRRWIRRSLLDHWRSHISPQSRPT